MSRARLLELWRYYQAGIANTAFGLGAYALLVWVGVNMYLAQFIAHVAGVVFNYMTYSRHVFRGAVPAKLRFIMSYAVNYFFGLGALALAAHFVASPYAAGAGAALIVSVGNYFALKHLVFSAKSAT